MRILSFDVRKGGEFNEEKERIRTISIVAIRENPKYSSEVIIYNTKFMPEISISNKYEYTS